MITNFETYADKVAYFRSQQPEMYAMFDDLLPAAALGPDSDEARAAQEGAK